jgi:hypothetical protein
MAENVSHALSATEGMRQLNLKLHSYSYSHFLPLAPNPQLTNAPLNLELPALGQQRQMAYKLDIPSHRLVVRKTYVGLVHHIVNKLLMMGRIRQLLMI